MDITQRIELLNELGENRKPLWGQMTPQHMVEHLYKAIQASINEISIDVLTEEKKISVLKRIFLGSRSLPKEFMNPAIGPDLLPLEFSNLDSAIDELKKVTERYNKYFDSNAGTKTAHPVFGYLTKSEWDLFHEKHFKHHLSQFGLVK